MIKLEDCHFTISNVITAHQWMLINAFFDDLWQTKIIQGTYS